MPEPSAPFPAGRRSPNSLPQDLADHLQKLIYSGQLLPETKLPSESELMSNHGVSRTVVREAISQLQARGHVQTKQGIGTFVLPIQKTQPILLPSVDTQEDVISVMEVRISIESEAAALAANRRTPVQLAEMRKLIDSLLQSSRKNEASQNLDQQFHQLIAQAANNRYLIEIMNSFRDGLIPRMRLNSNYLKSGRSSLFLQKRDQEHEEIYNAIKRQDPVAANAAMRLHLSNSRERVIEICSATPA